jgi:hypothetical protein
MNHAISPVFVSLEVAAERLGVPFAWLRKEAEQERVPTIRCGRRLVVDVVVVAECLRQRAAGPSAVRSGNVSAGGDDGE